MSILISFFYQFICAKTNSQYHKDNQKAIEKLLIPLLDECKPDLYESIVTPKDKKKFNKQKTLKEEKKIRYDLGDEPEYSPRRNNIVEILKYRNFKYGNKGTKDEDYKQCYYNYDKYKREDGQDI